MKYSEIKELTTEELIARISEEKAGLSKLKFAHAISKIENPMRIRQIRQFIASLSTELSIRNKAEAAV